MTRAALATDAGLRAIAHAGRRRMLRLVWDTERSSGDLAKRCGMARPATSQHLKVLRDAQLVSVRVAGNQRYYRARTDQLDRLRTALDSFWGDRLDRLHQAVREEVRRP